MPRAKKTDATPRLRHPLTTTDHAQDAWKEFCAENKIEGGAMPAWLGSVADWGRQMAPELWKDHGKDIVKKILMSAGPIVLTSLGVPPGLSKLVTDYAVGQVDKITVSEANQAVAEATAVTKKSTTRKKAVAKAEAAEKKKPRKKALIKNV